MCCICVGCLTKFLVVRCSAFLFTSAAVASERTGVACYRHVGEDVCSEFLICACKCATYFCRLINNYAVALVIRTSCFKILLFTHCVLRYVVSLVEYDIVGVVVLRKLCFATVKCVRVNLLVHQILLSNLSSCFHVFHFDDIHSAVVKVCVMLAVLYVTNNCISLTSDFVLFKY